MVAKFISGKSITGALNYNEHKLKKGQAVFIMANLYPKDLEELNFFDKLNRLENLAALNSRVKTNCVHVSLNFDLSEKIPVEQLQEIATAYMDKIGFGEQPYLVYQHLDAAHAHMHIVSTNIKKDGSRISLHNIGKTRSEKARKEIERDFKLVVAESKKQKQLLSLKPIALEKAVYGKSETKLAISNIVREVTKTYKFTSLPELNAVLRQFNVLADRGDEGTKMFENKGLLYSLVDEKGNKIGIPVKASSIYDKPTLPRLEEKFETNKISRNPYKEKIKGTLDSILAGQNIGRRSFIAGLKKKGISVAFRENAQGYAYGVTFIDNVTRIVFNGSDLGKQYSAKALTECFDKTEPNQLIPAPSKTYGIETRKADDFYLIPGDKSDTSMEYNNEPVPYALRKPKKKKKKRLRL